MSELDPGSTNGNCRRSAAFLPRSNCEPLEVEAINDGNCSNSWDQNSFRDGLTECEDFQLFPGSNPVSSQSFAQARPHAYERYRF